MGRWERETESGRDIRFRERKRVGGVRQHERGGESEVGRERE